MRILKNSDFTPMMYRRLLVALKEAGYEFMTFGEFCLNPTEKKVVMRHDVDRNPRNALRLAEIEAELEIRGSYHFRIAGSSNDPGTIIRIAGLGHEIAYHYEDIHLMTGKPAGGAIKQARKPGATAMSNGRQAEGTGILAAGKGNPVQETYKPSTEELSLRAWESFRSNLEYFRQFYPVRVISMHGTPLSGIDNRIIWKYFDYHECGIVCEPYFDIDYSDTLYLTDTGRRWDGERYSVRDRAVSAVAFTGTSGFEGWRVRPVRGSLLSITTEGEDLRNHFSIKLTKEIITLLAEGRMPGKLVINTHPQRWTESPVNWLKELVMQSLKNQVKRILLQWRSMKAGN